MKQFSYLIYALIAITFLFYSKEAYSQTEAARQEFYNGMIARGEAAIKSYNVSKKEIDDKISEAEQIAYNEKYDQFVNVYALFLTMFNKRIVKLENEFNQMNRLSALPDMNYLKNMNQVQEKKILLLSKGVRFYEEISAEINSKPSKRWDYIVVDNFVTNEFSLEESEVYIRLRPVCNEVDLLARSQYKMSLLNCKYKYWKFQISSGFSGMSELNPQQNYNTSSRLDLSPQQDYDYEKSLFSCWMDTALVKDYLTVNEKGFYSDVVANSYNSLLLVSLLSSIDFPSSKLNTLLRKCNMPIKECAYDQRKKELINYYTDYSDALEYCNVDSALSFIKQEINSIRLLYSILPDNPPIFYANIASGLYQEQIRQFDPDWHRVFEIKKMTLLSRAYRVFIANELSFNGINSNLFERFVNGKANEHKLYAYHKNESMKALGKTESQVWEADYNHAQDVLKLMHRINYQILNNFSLFTTGYNKLKSSEELGGLLESLGAESVSNYDSTIVSDYPNEFWHYSVYKSYKNGKQGSSSYNELNSIGWRFLIRNQLDSAEKYFSEGLIKSPENIMITINMAHVRLFKGDYRAAVELYKKYPMSQSIPDLDSIDVRSCITQDFLEFSKKGKDPKTLAVITSELQL